MSKTNTIEIHKCIDLLKTEKSYEILNKFMRDVPRETLKGCINYLLKFDVNKYNQLIKELSDL